MNLGAGCLPLEGFWNVDAFPGDKIDQVVDLNGPWPWADRSVWQIFSSHCVEHLASVEHFMREAHRVLAPGGQMEIRVPHGWSTAAMGDPTHIRPLYPVTFLAFCNGYGTQYSRNLQHDHVRWDFAFECNNIEIVFHNWVKRIPFWRKWAPFMSDYILNMAGEIRVHITKKQTI